MRKLSAIFFLLLPTFLVAQQHPFNLKWKKINTAHFEVVFPENITDEGKRTANMLEFLYEPVSLSLNAKPKPLTVFLFNQTTTSNGFVTLAPSYSAWFTTPPPDAGLAGSNEWLQTLSVHEFRHVAQNKKENQRFTRFMNIMLGQAGRQAGSVFMPIWFSEGDAVGIETVLTKGGRGRNPAFERGMRTILLSEEKYSYSKAYLGSYKDYTPNHYPLGYFMTTHVRRTHGYNVWSDVLDRYTGYSFWPFAFSRSMKKTTGLNTQKTYDSTMSELNERWGGQTKNTKFDEPNILSPQAKKVWTNYYNPSFLDDSRIVVRKHGFDLPPTITIIGENGEDEIVQISDYKYISAGGQKVAWNTKTPDARWDYRNYSDIMIYDFETKAKKRLTKKQRFSSPSLSPDGKRIATIEFTTVSECSLLILDVENGDIQIKKTAEKNAILRRPAWSATGDKIVYTSTGISGISLIVFDIMKNEFRTLINNTFEIIGDAVFYKDYVLYNSTFSGIENIHAININTLERYQITTSKFGASNAKVSPDEEFMIFQDYNLKGFDVAQMHLNPPDWQKTTNQKYFESNYYKPLIEQEKRDAIDWEKELPKKDFKVKKSKTLTSEITTQRHAPFLPFY